MSYGGNALFVISLAIALLAAACSATSDQASTPVAPAAEATTAAPATARERCSPALAQPAGMTEVSIPATGDVATLVHVPPAYDGIAALPLLLNFHGGGGSPQEQYDRSQRAATADRHGFLLVTPPVGPVDSAATVLDAVIAGWCVDPARIYSTGVSGGARH